ncbi:hypothetical protein HBH98_188890 [Parastagonospora nodorum]|nr:hypothetical protein HBH51_157540 [Parastagonospora nodorum]KAH4093379.1 hypothetical protein HBH46_179980 [Parastagonospora nodorum]KAH4159797.1 hypothetical protein HBH43_184450 [Parastagonospora nodorum]KAH4187834.1 hypothetical protein HBH42_150810 [Parastagonospora nodorum]KAH4209818.1 hypothetical protein HBI95_081230 [Parastagonospora nodorum]
MRTVRRVLKSSRVALLTWDDGSRRITSHGGDEVSTYTYAALQTPSFLYPPPRTTRRKYVKANACADLRLGRYAESHPASTTPTRCTKEGTHMSMFFAIHGLNTGVRIMRLAHFFRRPAIWLVG